MSIDYVVVIKNIRMPNPIPLSPLATKSYPEVFCAVPVDLEQNLVKRIFDLEKFLKTGHGISDEIITIDYYYSYTQFNGSPIN